MMDISIKENLIQYLRGLGLADNREKLYVHYFSGGVSGVAAFVRTGERELLVKQACEKLKVAADWECSPKRIKVEYCALKIYKDIVPTCVPKPISFDEENMVTIREAVPEDWRMWKTELLEGVLDYQVAGKAIDALCRVHNETAGRKDAMEQCADPQFFRMLRIEAYIQQLLKGYPRLKEKIDRVCAMLMTEHITLIHGDYSPKNILIKDHEICILDFEVAYYGNPCFDIAFFANHFLLKAVKNRELAEQYFALLLFMTARYFSNMTYAEAAKTEKETIETLGFLFLARIDGKSPVEYLQEEGEKNTVRTAALRIIDEEPETFQQAVNIVREEIGRE